MYVGDQDDPETERLVGDGASMVKEKPGAVTKRDSGWLGMIPPIITAIIGVVLFFLPITDVRFWTFDYILFLAFLLGVPLLCRPRRVKELRAVIILFALAYFGFLQAACPRVPGAIELLLLQFFDHHPVTMHLIKVSVFLLMGLIFGRYYCGWICPKGVIQEYIYRPRVGITPPPKVDRALKYLKYAMLLCLILWPLAFQQRFFREYGPFKVIFNLGGETYLVVILVVVLLASVFIERAFCRYLCPEGALLALAQLISPYKMRLDLSRCSKCQRCVKVCPVDAFVLEGKCPVAINAAECLTCKECEGVCREGSLSWGPGHPLRTSSAPLRQSSITAPPCEEKEEQ